MSEAEDIIKEIVRLEEEIKKYPIGLLVENPNINEHNRINYEIGELWKRYDRIEDDRKADNAIAIPEKIRNRGKRLE
ncbi:MAG TPA: hypothetical protein EYQ42_09685 [Thiotrichaceae bacterium]|jgi:hypothetical protein|nr:hypothetical protein [Thiotrichaceae bacterium]